VEGEGQIVEHVLVEQCAALAQVVEQGFLVPDEVIALQVVVNRRLLRVAARLQPSLSEWPSRSLQLPSRVNGLGFDFRMGDLVGCCLGYCSKFYSCLIA
jgi:hypothetical protein